MKNHIFSLRRCLFVICILFPVLNACDSEVIKDILSQRDIDKGLKTALELGTDSTVSVLSKSGGYLKDQAIKILLPDEAWVIVNNINQYPILKTAVDLALNINFDHRVEEMVGALNQAAENAAKEAAPIFKNAITGMTISDGLSILNGTNPAGKSVKSAAFDSTAATAYLRSSTYADLVTAYSKPVNNVLETGGDNSPAQLWKKFTGLINDIAALPVVSNYFEIEPVTTDLGGYVTGKALDGLFCKVGNVEKDIRKDPFGWAGKTGKNIISVVFGHKE